MVNGKFDITGTLNVTFDNTDLYKLLKNQGREQTKAAKEDCKTIALRQVDRICIDFGNISLIAIADDKEWVEIKFDNLEQLINKIDYFNCNHPCVSLGDLCQI